MDEHDPRQPLSDLSARAKEELESKLKGAREIEFTYRVLGFPKGFGYRDGSDDSLWYIPGEGRGVSDKDILDMYLDNKIWPIKVLEKFPDGRGE